MLTTMSIFIELLDEIASFLADILGGLSRCEERSNLTTNRNQIFKMQLHL